MADEISFKINIPTDNDGFITLQCPYCDRQFKLIVNFIEREDILELFCPYCGLRHKTNQFLRDEVMKQAQIIASNLAKKFINQSLKNLESKFRANKSISFKFDKPLEMESEKLLYEREEFDMARLRCCEVDVKVNSLCREIGIYCPCCGMK